MSSYKGHIAGAMVFFILFIVALSYIFVKDKLSLSSIVINIIVLFWITILFALWPDVDIRSKGQWIFYRLFFLADASLILFGYFRSDVFYYKAAALLGFFALLPIIGKHRGWTHSIWAAVFLPSPILFVPIIFEKETTLIGLPYYLAAEVGYFSHLVIDGTLFRQLFGKRSKK